MPGIAGLEALSLLKVELDVGCGCHNMEHHDKASKHQSTVPDEAVMIPIALLQVF